MNVLHAPNPNPYRFEEIGARNEEECGSFKRLFTANKVFRWTCKVPPQVSNRLINSERFNH